MGPTVATDEIIPKAREKMLEHGSMALVVSMLDMYRNDDTVYAQAFENLAKQVSAGGVHLKEFFDLFGWDEARNALQHHKNETVISEALNLFTVVVNVSDTTNMNQFLSDGTLNTAIVLLQTHKKGSALIQINAMQALTECTKGMMLCKHMAAKDAHIFALQAIAHAMLETRDVRIAQAGCRFLAEIILQALKLQLGDQLTFPDSAVEILIDSLRAFPDHIAVPESGRWLSPVASCKNEYSARADFQNVSWRRSLLTADKFSDSAQTSANFGNIPAKLSTFYQSLDSVEFTFCLVFLIASSTCARERKRNCRILSNHVR